MLGRAASHLRSNVVAYVALFVALGGTSYAATTLPRNSVGTWQLRKGAVTASKVRPHSLTARAFKKGHLPVGPPGAQGPAGPQGPAVGQGPQAAVKSALAFMVP
jgi:hypothetical protein